MTPVQLDVPQGWRKARVEEVILHFQNGYAFSASDYVESGIPIVTMANISLEGQFQYDPSKVRYWDERELNNLSRYVLNEGDLLIAMTDVTPGKNLIGRMASVNCTGPLLLNQRVGHLTIDSQQVSETFLAYYSNFKLWRKYCKAVSSAGVQANLSTKDIKKGQILLPPLPEQRKIAAILSTWDEAITLTGRLIEALQRRKKGLMQRLLAGDVRFPEFEGNEWSYVHLGDLAKVRRGASPRPIRDPKWFSESGRGWIRIADINASPTRFLEETTQYLSPLGEEKSVPVEVGQLILSIAATIGVPKIVNIPACIHDGFVLITDYEDHLDRDFLYHFFSSLTTRLQNSGQPGTQKNLNSTLVRLIEVPYVSQTEQQKVASVLTLAEDEIYSLTLIIDELKRQKKGLMQCLLTGEIRVAV